eukprot:1158306-Pelagomonas_calceolata.AAC.18
MLPSTFLMRPRSSSLFVAQRCPPYALQASFEPLGFTVAVAKDRAIESLMQGKMGLLSACRVECAIKPCLVSVAINYLALFHLYGAS